MKKLIKEIKEQLGVKKVTASLVAEALIQLTETKAYKKIVKNNGGKLNKLEKELNSILISLEIGVVDNKVLRKLITIALNSEALNEVVSTTKEKPAKVLTTIDYLVDLLNKGNYNAEDIENIMLNTGFNTDAIGMFKHLLSSIREDHKKEYNDAYLKQIIKDVAVIINMDKFLVKNVNNEAVHIDVEVNNPNPISSVTVVANGTTLHTQYLVDEGNTTSSFDKKLEKLRNK